MFLELGEICWICCHNAGRQKSWQPSPAESETATYMWWASVERGRGRQRRITIMMTQIGYVSACVCVCVVLCLLCLEVGFIYLYIYFFIFFFLFGVSNNPKCQNTQTGDTWHVRLVIVSLAFGWLSIHLNIFPTHPKADKNKIVKNHKA